MSDPQPLQGDLQSQVMERDADRWSLGRRNDRLALASVIAKAAQSRSLAAGVTFVPLAGAGVLERVRQLMDDGGPVQQGKATAMHYLAIGLVAVTVGPSAVVPMAVAASVEQLPPGATVRHCLD